MTTKHGPSEIAMKWSPVVALTAGVIAAAASSFGYFGSGRTSVDTAQADRIAEVQKDLAKVNAYLDELPDYAEILVRLRELEAIGDSLTDIPPNAQLSAQIETSAIAITTLGSRMTDLESIILEDPAKALMLIRVKDQIAALEESIDGESVARVADVNRAFDMMKWFLALMITTAVGLIGLAITTMISQKKGQ